MKILLSPAKSMDFDSELPTDRSSEVDFSDQSIRLNKLLKKKSARSLGKLMNISPNLADLNFERNQAWSFPFEENVSRQAIYAFNGEAYRGMDSHTFTDSELNYAQDSLRILSGLYGMLKPMDRIMPYRLEMGTKIKVGVKKNLYEFWKPKLTKALNGELREDEIVVNVASNEYSKALDLKSLKGQVITCHFKELRGDEYKVIMTFAKFARGLMARYLIQSKAETLDDIKSFNLDGYGYAESLSTDTELVFTR
ncbi:peroxide stress protein YaaA [Aureitalea marina]|uniref:UPF0246 protein BST85_08205 n=1 Tax=Aureitalea marina TaxID=930804 RepID=A0A2S7KQH1_9FLAO|nr:peroxide stress protein YaaA [Aureitalea marina]PQB04874.1 hypothetical protein BST85_08205 [Aureitalea marina]